MLIGLTAFQMEALHLRRDAWSAGFACQQAPKVGALGEACTPPYMMPRLKQKAQMDVSKPVSATLA